MKMFIKNLIKAFGHAIDGWEVGLRERNTKIHLIMSALVIILGVFFQISTTEWLVIIMLIGMVISAELFNTAIEEVCNIMNEKLKLQYSDTTFARDLAAGAVFIVACCSALIGVIIFAPKVITLLL